MTVQIDDEGSKDAFATGEYVALGGYAILSTTQDAFAAELLSALQSRQKRRVFFANTNFVVQCRPLRTRMAAAPTLRIVNDGLGMDLGALCVHGRRFAGNLNGTDLIPFLCWQAKTPLKLFLVGSASGVARAAGETLHAQLGQDIVGVCDGYGELTAAGPALVERINRSDADVVLVAFGNPMQERWILDNADALDAPLVFGVGALLDFLSGKAQRAPAWIRRVRMEWLYRLLREPRRLLKRYSWDLLVFFRVCLREGRRGAPVQGDTMG